MFVFKGVKFYVYHEAAPRKTWEKHDCLLARRAGSTQASEMTNDPPSPRAMAGGRMTKLE